MTLRSDLQTSLALPAHWGRLELQMYEALRDLAVWFDDGRDLHDGRFFASLPGGLVSNIRHLVSDAERAGQEQRP